MRDPFINKIEYIRGFPGTKTLRTKAMRIWLKVKNKQLDPSYLEYYDKQLDLEVQCIQNIRKHDLEPVYKWLFGSMGKSAKIQIAAVRYLELIRLGKFTKEHLYAVENLAKRPLVKNKLSKN